MYLITTPWWLRMFYPGCLWQMPGKNKTVYLTFDDGPHPVATPFVLQQLQQYDALATFFCIGKNVEKHTALYQEVLAAGHTTGNHTMHHLNGWKVSDEEYLQEIADADSLIKSNLFRPPYGRIKFSQVRKVKSPQDAVQKRAKVKMDTIVMWSVIAADFDTSLNGEQCYQNVIKNVRPGSIIVFHDSAKAMPRLQYALPKSVAVACGKWIQDESNLYFPEKK